MNREAMIKKYPIGSKLVGTYLGHKYTSEGIPCKVVGYSRHVGSILVYNLEIVGHSGNMVCVDEGGIELSEGRIHQIYGRDCWYVVADSLMGRSIAK